MPVTDGLRHVLSSISLCNLYLTLVQIIIQHLFVRLQDPGQLKQEMLLKDSGAIEHTKTYKKTQQYHLSSSCETTHKRSLS